MTSGHPTTQPYSRAGLLAKLTGAATLAAGALLHGQGTALLATLPLGSAGSLMVAGASAPAWSDSGLSYASGVLTVAGSAPSTPTSGQVLIGGGAVKAGGAISGASLTVTGAITHTGVNTASGSTASRLAYFGGTSGDGAAIELRGSTYSGSPDTGFLRVGSTYVGNWTTAGITLSTGTLTVPNGTAAAPGIRTSENHGLYRYASNALGFSVAGTLTSVLYTPAASLYGGAWLFANPAADQPGVVGNLTATSFLAIYGGTSLAGGAVKVYGTAHATKPSYVEFARGATVSAYFDNSGNLLCNGTVTVTALASAAATSLIFSPAGTERARFAGTTGNLLIGTTSDYGTALTLDRQKTLTGAVGSDISCISVRPSYTGAHTVSRADYFAMRRPALTGSAAVTDACVFYFDAAAGTHEAVAAGSSKASPGIVSAWVKIDINGTIHYMSAYTSMTS